MYSMPIEQLLRKIGFIGYVEKGIIKSQQILNTSNNKYYHDTLASNDLDSSSK